METALTRKLMMAKARVWGNAGRGVSGMTATAIPAPYGWWMREKGTDQWFPVVAWAIRDGQGDKGPHAMGMTVVSFKHDIVYDLHYDANGAPS